MSKHPDTLIVGKVGAPYGVKGWVKINSFTQEKQNIFEYAPWQLQFGNKPAAVKHNGSQEDIVVEQWRNHNNSLIAKLAGIDDRDSADSIKNADILIQASKLPELENEFYWKDLIGMQVVSTAGYKMGTVKELLETGANDVLLVKANINDAFGQKERLIPFLQDSVVHKVDAPTNTITVDWDPAF